LKVWEKVDKTWSDFKVKDWYDRAAKLAADEVFVKNGKIAAVTAAESKLEAAKEAAAAAAATFESCEAGAEGMEEAQKAVDAANEAVTSAEAAVTTARDDLSVPVQPRIVPDLPYHSKVDLCAWTTLVYGTANFSHVEIPVDTMPGEYVLIISDAVNPVCQFTEKEMRMKKQAAADEGSQQSSAKPAEAIAGDEKNEKSALPLSSVKNMLRMVKSLPDCEDIRFKVFDPKAVD
jgi:hypothetical protein